MTLQCPNCRNRDTTRMVFDVADTSSARPVASRFVGVICRLCSTRWQVDAREAQQELKR